ncbi:acyl-CoA thioesterase [Aureimonas glaciei]|uniref:4-hydroxybenzoyl-CoA thioesterase n=1 Tax=Aureimonas glaciei TaxID=1776957 RepID=A0A917DBA7_9HYPH|nr:acyl-CoA thioesterase [Aureimonas glaciei]GGD23173.1 4-hydroxybenzoyl-CoA thioesterase [Aureimonas glaciei]
MDRSATDPVSGNAADAEKEDALDRNAGASGQGGKTFTADYTLRFGQCDPAGIAFFPRLIEMLNWVVEDWFAKALDADFRSIHIARDEGVPARSLSIDFIGPAELGDVLTYRLQVASLGRSSINLAIAAEREGGRPVLTATHTIVYCDLSGAAPKSMAIPDALRERMAVFLVPA